jgi:TonB family protein
MKHLQPGVLAALAIFTPAFAQDRAADWLKRPTADDLLAVWPARAYQQHKSGKATIGCIVTVQGTLRDCKVLEETPEGAGFGGAALALSTQFLMRPAMEAGAPVESTVRIPIDFKMPRTTTGSHLGTPPNMDLGMPLTSRVYTSLPWRRAPTYAEVLAAYPEKARTAKIGGAVVLDCKIKDDGGLSGCRTLNETPRGQGFAKAAKSLADRFETPVTTGEGESIAGSRAHLKITFAAETIEASKPVIGRPKWLALPAVNDLAAVMPAAAREAGVYKARVMMNCDVGSGGAVVDCVVENEAPGELGYGAAAVSLSQYFRLAVWTDEGLPTVGGSVRIPLRFDFQPPPASAQP